MLDKFFKSSQCWRAILSRSYSTPPGVVTREAMRKWHVSDAQKPLSVVLSSDSDSPIDLSEPSDEDNPRNPDLPPLHKRRPPKDPTPPIYAAHRATLSKSFPDGWNPPRKISREAMSGLRALHASDPTTFTTAVLAEKFKISPEGVRRILKSRWVPGKERVEKGVRKEREWYSGKMRREREELESVVKAKKERYGRDGLDFQ